MSTAERIRESAGRSFRRAGAAGVAGVALALFAVSFDLSGNRSLDAEADSLQQESRALSRRLRQPAPVALSERGRLEAFHAGFPGAAALPDLLRRLHGHALARGVEVDKADYRTAADTASPLERITLELPARGPYGALRGWITDVLAEMPEVAVEHLSLQRAAIGVPALEARVRFVIFVRRRP